MYTDILINATFYENRIALVENGNLREFHLDRLSERGLIGNIYLGRVVRVLPGIDAAFVDIGLERTGFLYVEEAQHLYSESYQRLPPGHKLHQDPPRHLSTPPMINELVREGQDILVQIAKEPIGSKGARLTCNITLPCRNLVFMPLTDHIGISRKIEDEATRQLLREKIEGLRPPGAGFIMRTVAENIGDEELEADMEFLLLLWDEILGKARKATVPSLIYKDLDIILRAMRDFFTEETNELVTDSREVYEQLLSYAKNFAPHLQDRITFYDSDLPLFEYYGIEADISSALDKKVWLRSGGYIVIEPTEALTVIDVNSGRYVGANDLAETIFKTNMEAVREIARQLRLRNLGGIIIIDFIDMVDAEHRRQVLRTLEKSLAKDHAKTTVYDFSPLGLVEMTRKRTVESLERQLCEPCHECGGRGMLKTAETVTYEIFREIVRAVRQFDAVRLLVIASPKVVGRITDEESNAVAELEEFLGKSIRFQADTQYLQEQFDVVLL